MGLELRIGPLQISGNADSWVSCLVPGLAALLAHCGYDGIGWSSRLFGGADGTVSYWDPGPSGLLSDCGCEGARASIGPFQDLWGYRQECLLQGLCASKNVHILWLRWEPNYMALSESAAYLQGLPDHGREGQELVHGPLQGLQLGPSSICLLLMHG